jgi:putative transposase
VARKLRLEFSGACYHVINRGNYRRNLFETEGAAACFETCLVEAGAKFRWRVHAFVIMRNHFHLAVETPEPNLSVGMKWLQGTWAARFNRYRGQVGRPFQGRYKALHVEPGHALAQVAHYIHLNPARANVETVEQLGNFRWSSLHWFLSNSRPACLEPNTVLAESGGLADTFAGWQCYIGYLGVLADEDVRRGREKFGRLSRGWGVGSAGYLTALQRDLAALAPVAQNFELLGADRAAVLQARATLWEQCLQRIASCLNVDLSKLPAAKSAESKVRLTALMKLGTSVSNVWLAQRLGMGCPGGVTQFVHDCASKAELSRRHSVRRCREFTHDPI